MAITIKVKYHQHIQIRGAECQVIITLNANLIIWIKEFLFVLFLFPERFDPDTKCAVDQLHT